MANLVDRQGGGSWWPVAVLQHKYAYQKEQRLSARSTQNVATLKSRTKLLETNKVLNY